jgi:choline-sulfatase
VTQALWDLYEGAEIALPHYPAGMDSAYSAMDGWLNDVHEVDQVALRDPDNLRLLRRAYYGLVTYIDQKVGELLAALDQTGQRANTIVVFTSDHGDMLAEKGMVQKRCFYEWSVRVPLLVELPDGRAAGRRVSAPVSLMDLVPTLLDWARYPEADRLPMDAVSLAGLTETGAGPLRPIFSEYHVEKVHAPCFMVRLGKYKYIYIHGHDSQLFDLEADPDEWHNLAGQASTAGLQAELHALILSRFDPDQVAADGAASVRRRDLIRQAMARNHTSWDYFPYFDASAQYVR